MDLEEIRQAPIEDKYRFVFGSEVGLEVLADIMAMCHVGQHLDPDNKNEVIAHNLGLSIMAKASREDNYKNVIKSMLGLRRNPQ